MSKANTLGLEEDPQVELRERLVIKLVVSMVAGKHPDDIGIHVIIDKAIELSDATYKALNK